MSQRIAVVLFNLGGPDNPDAIRPFLFNLFADPAIIRIPNPARVIVAGPSPRTGRARPRASMPSSAAARRSCPTPRRRRGRWRRLWPISAR
jgi:Ferrochelatase